MYVDTVALRFGIESSILFDRIAQDRRRRQEEALRDRQRRAGDSAGGSPSDGGAGNDGAPDGGWNDGGVLPDSTGQASQGPLLENRILAPAESDLLYFLLCYGQEKLDFATDSPYYSGDEELKQSVAEFIREAMDADCTVFANSAYRALYDE